MSLISVIIVLIFLQDVQRENCLGNDESSKEAVKFLLGSVSSKYPTQPVSLENVNTMQLPFNTFGQTITKCKLVNSEMNGDMRDITSSRLLINDLKKTEEDLTRLLVILMAVLTSVIWMAVSFISILICIICEHRKRNLTEIFDEEQQIKAIARLGRRVAKMQKTLIRYNIGCMNDFGSDFAKGVKIDSLQNAVKYVLKRCGENSDDISQRLKFICSKVRDFLRPSNDTNKSEFVTGIQKDILIWYLKEVMTHRHQNHDELKDKVRKFPWMGEDGKLSLVNVRKCIRYVHKDFKPTLDFLAQTIDWNDLNSFSRRPNEGKTKGHGLYFLMHHLYANSNCELISATAHKPHSLFPFPPPGEIKIDAQGRIETGADKVTIRIGKIRNSKKRITKAKKQLGRSLIFIAGLHKLIAENDDVSPICYDLVGYIFCCTVG